MFQKNTQIKLQNNLFITHLKRHYLQGDSRQVIKQCKHSSIYAVNVGTHKKRGKQKPDKSRLLGSTKGEENGIES